VSVETVERVQPARSFFVELAEILLLAVGLYIVITFAIQTVHVIGFSMVPTLNDNDYVLATKIDLRFTTPSRGDIVILKDPFDNSQDFVKRVIALPGERLKITNGRVFINEQLLQEPYLPKNDPWVGSANYPVDGSDPNGIVIPAGHYFVMGDNRNHSSDSRVFGPIAFNQIESRAWIRLLPLDKFGPVAQHPALVPAVARLDRRRAA
jgi:signal peptidase I